MIGNAQDASLGEAKVSLVEHLGGTTVLYLQTAGGDSLTVLAAGQVAVCQGDRLPLTFNPAQGHVFQTGGDVIRP